MALTHTQRSERRKNIATKVKKGESPTKVATDCGVSISTVLSACKEYRVKVSINARDKQKVTRSTAADIIRNGGTIADACRRSGLSAGCVYNSCYEFGVKIPGKINNGGQNDRKKNREAAVADLKRGRPISEICKDHYLSVSTLKNACVEFGAPFPSTPVVIKYSQLQKLMVLKLLMGSDETIREIESKTGVSASAINTLYRTARQAGLILKYRGPGRRKGKKYAKK